MRRKQHRTVSLKNLMSSIKALLSQIKKNLSQLQRKQGPDGWPSWAGVGLTFGLGAAIYFYVLGAAPRRSRSLPAEPPLTTSCSTSPRNLQSDDTSPPRPQNDISSSSIQPRVDRRAPAEHPQNKLNAPKGKHGSQCPA